MFHELMKLVGLSFLVGGKLQSHIVPPSVSTAVAVEIEHHALLRARRKEHGLVVIALWTSHVLCSRKGRICPHVLQDDGLLRLLMCDLVHIHAVVAGLRFLNEVTVLAEVLELSGLFVLTGIEKVVTFRAELQAPEHLGHHNKMRIGKDVDAIQVQVHCICRCVVIRTMAPKAYQGLCSSW